ncbi:lipid-A-disaccharide synthase N-terminal domain-containing protein [Flaviflagellibacter deserti]|jgi:lipid-A-disaccharide synthase-like uncharacterized protein|uniref:Lipid-A-disaccharide synthase N-terminal domain-containing protein n=1 Tax=Flaviflagellibacter deserti TaxID=2267266 RepID=A0ABV9Z0G8_9HYPH
MILSSLWMLVGIGGQALFSARFLIQWLASEKRGESTTPVAFWFFSLGGGVLLMIYALHVGDPIFMAGQGFGLAVYLRNLHLIRKRAKLSEATA